MSNVYLNKIFYDVFVCWFLNSMIVSQEDKSINYRMDMVVDFSFENGAFVFKYNDLSFNLDNISLYKDFHQFLINKLYNYGFSIIIDNSNKNDCGMTMIEKGTVDERIKISGTSFEFMTMLDYEIYQQEKDSIKNHQKVKI